MIQHTVEDHISILTLANGNTNPFTADMLNRLGDIIKEVNNDDDRKGIVLTGAGKVFSSGFDISMFLNFKGKDDFFSFFSMEEQVLLDFFTCKKPVVMALNGHTVAAGLIFSMAADYRIIKNHPKIKVGMSEIKIGLPLSVAQYEVMRFGLDSQLKYRDIMFFGELMDVAKARDMAIVDEIVEADQLIRRAKEIVTLWYDTPGRPFVELKRLSRKHTADQIRQGIETGNWDESLRCFFNETVLKTLAFVQASQ